MSNWNVAAADRPQAITAEAVRSLRRSQVEGISRRRLLRASLGAGIGTCLPAYGPARRSMDRFPASVDDEGVLILDAGKTTLGPLAVALRQPGIIPPKSPMGCI